MYIHEITLETADLKGTEAFYAGTLGMSLRRRAPGLLSFVAGTSVLTFSETRDKTPAPGHFAFNIPPRQIKEAIAWLSARVPLLLDEEGSPHITFESWHAEAAYFYDNNGNIVEFIARHDLEHETDAPFGIHSLMSVSEIAFVTDDPTALAEQWRAIYGLDFFSKRKPTPEFIALGDDYGLFIIVKTGRVWYPTQQKAILQKPGVRFSMQEMEVRH